MAVAADAFVADRGVGAVALPDASRDVIMGYSKKPQRGQPLTNRETEIVGVILAGHTTTKTIGKRLAISSRTVGTHLSTIYEKAGAANMTDLVLIALGAKESPVGMNIIWE